MACAIEATEMYKNQHYINYVKVLLQLFLDKRYLAVRPRITCKKKQNRIWQQCKNLQTPFNVILRLYENKNPPWINFLADDIFEDREISYLFNAMYVYVQDLLFTSHACCGAVRRWTLM